MANGEWDVKQSYFQGYVKAKLEGHDTELKDIKEKLEKNSKFIERLKVKVGIISAGAGIFFAAAWHFMKYWLK